MVLRGQGTVHVGFYAAIRFSLWLIGVVVAILPVLLHDKVDLDWNPLEMARQANAAGIFRELLFVIIPVSVLAISTLLDYICKSYYKLSGTAVFFSVLGLLVNGCSLFTSLIGFVKIHHNAVLMPSQFRTYMILMGLGLIFSFVTEMALALEHRR